MVRRAEEAKGCEESDRGAGGLERGSSAVSKRVAICSEATPGTRLVAGLVVVAAHAAGAIDTGLGVVGAVAVVALLVFAGLVQPGQLALAVTRLAGRGRLAGLVLGVAGATEQVTAL